MLSPVSSDINCFVDEKIGFYEGPRDPIVRMRTNNSDARADSVSLTGKVHSTCPDVARYPKLKVGVHIEAWPCTKTGPRRNPKGAQLPAFVYVSEGLFECHRLTSHADASVLPVREESSLEDLHLRRKVMLRHDAVAREDLERYGEFKKGNGRVGHCGVLCSSGGPFELCQDPINAIPPDCVKRNQN